ncbi:hypothetical protein CP97_14749 [Aurantiacibacter atlanticus]|uniref:Uncharacterized protein n=1 Tax=Aurantiacibacter atlanticus TaxID=1648404 RepID=A0A168M1W5_9SPHN|nr:hypothetical protein CP97_14749 [Aurantiacibacter atlanticus]
MVVAAFDGSNRAAIKPSKADIFIFACYIATYAVFSLKQ